MYRFKEITLKNGPNEKKVLVIDFEDPKMAIVGEFLMTDAPLLNYSILKDIEHVRSGASNYEESSGNRCALFIRKDTTQIEDLFAGIIDEEDVFSSYEIGTEELSDLVHMWREKKATFQEGG